MQAFSPSAAARRPARTVEFADGTNAWRSTEAAADPALAGLVTGYTDYWERTGSFSIRRELPSLRPVMIVNLGAPIAVTGGDGGQIVLQAGEGFLAGLHDRHALSASRGGQAGVHVWLTMRGYQLLLGAAAGVTANQAVPMADLLAAPGAAVRGAAALGARLQEASCAEHRFQILDGALAGLAAADEKLPAELAWAFAAIRRRPGLRVHDLANGVGWSRKRLTERFQARFGLAPKTVARIARFERVIAASENGQKPDWAGIAAAAGYFDQGHMIRDFSALAGLTPAAYHRRLLPGAGLIEA